MHSFILMVLLSVISGSAMAEWIQIGRASNTIIYADPSTIRKKGNIVKMWLMMDYSKVTGENGDQYLSQIAQHIYDCEEELSRMVAFTTFSENIGKGQIVFRVGDNPSKWQPSSPGSIGALEMKFACKA